MGDLLLAEELFLLAHDDETGKARTGVNVHTGYAGALLLDLAAAHVITMKGKDVVAAETASPVPVLEQARAVIAEEERPRKVAHWISVLPRKIAHLDAVVGRSLVERGVVGEEHGKALGIFPRTTWPERDPEPERRLRAELDAALVGGAEPSPRLAQLIALLHAVGSVGFVFGKPHRREAQKRAKVIAEHQVDGAEVSDAVADAVQAVQAAVMVAVIVPAVTSATS